jgi:uncharacterized protein involved in exopolysaccharide biosynthesis
MPLQSKYPSSEELGVAGQPITPLTLLNAVLRQRQLIFAITVAAVVFAVAKGLMTKQQFVATASFSPSSSAANSSVSGLAAQLGMDVSDQNSSQSPDFYADLLKSRPLLQPIVQAMYPASVDGRQSQRSLIEILDAGGSTNALRLERAVRALRSAMQISLSQKTGVVTFTVRGNTPELTSRIAQNILQGVNEFNVETRRTQASSERRFTEQRVNEIRGELDAAESRLLDFVRTNRSISGDPALQLAQNRLTREVERLQGLYDSLTQSLERAKIDEVRDTPAITVIERPEQSVLPAPRNRVRNVIVAGIFGCLLGLLLAFLRDIMARDQLTNQAEREEFNRLREDLRRNLHLRPLRSVKPES